MKKSKIINIKFGIRGLSGTIASFNIGSLGYQYHIGFELSSFFHTGCLASLIVFNSLYIDRAVTTLRCKKRKKQEREVLAKDLENYTIKNDEFSKNLSEILKDPENIGKAIRNLKEINISDEEDEEKLEQFKEHMNILTKVIEKNREAKIQEQSKECTMF